ncbi:MAG: DUF4040 domain-containing protein [Gammaproteobacteria bacterium]|nr:DUF4040 domain-containing protein [Gammaproteobacteria bacterium]
MSNQQAIKGPGSSFNYIALSLIPFSLFVALIVGLVQFPLPWQWSQPWVSSLDIALAFRVDAFSMLMLMLITGIGTMVFIYGSGYLSHTPGKHRIFFVLIIFMMAMIGAVTADDVILFFVFWELTSITSFLLVGFNHASSDARDSARQALFVTMAGGIALLAGLLLLSDMAGTWSLSGIVAAAPTYMDDPRLSYAIILVLIGAFTKSAQFPFHFWLPNAMSAPTPVSAYLHSATMVKLGIYLMARLDPAFNELLLWELLLIGAGAITAVWAAVLALRERDLKRILARSTLSALGTLTLLIGLPSSSAGLAVIAFLFAHAVYKAPLFMVAGNIDHVTGTRQIDHLMGLRRVMPWTAAAAILAGLSMAGLPMAFGFVAKDIMAVAKEQSELVEIVGYGLLLVNAVAMAVAAVAAIRVFWGPLEKSFVGLREANWRMVIPPLMLAIIGVEFELFPDFIDPLLLSAAQSISPSSQLVEISTSYSFQNMFSATGISALIAIFLFLAWDRIHDRLASMRWLDNFGPEASYEVVLTTLKKTASIHTRFLQSGRLDKYLLLTISALIAMSFYVFWNAPIQMPAFNHWPMHSWAWLVAGGLMSIGAVVAVFLQNRLALLMAVGLIGYGSAILFLFAGAPDLAFTQFTVETVLVVIAATVIPFFKHAPYRETPWKQPLKLLLALLAGAGTFILLMNLQAIPENRDLASWFASNSLPQANGRNVVNVIIVDFRALDTLGEIAVVAFSLLAAKPLFTHISANRSEAASGSVLLEKLAVPLYWMMLTAALWILLRGHNEPGGGFIGGLVAVAASSQLAILYNSRFARKYQYLMPSKLAMLGIGMAMVAGMAGLITGEGFLRHVEIAGLSSVLLFDLGVFLTVWGSFTGYVYSLLERHELPLETSEQGGMS